MLLRVTMRAYLGLLEPEAHDAVTGGLAVEDAQRRPRREAGLGLGREQRLVGTEILDQDLRGAIENKNKNKIKVDIL